MEKSYTEAELRQKLIDNTTQIEDDFIGRLRDDGAFKSHTISFPAGGLILDGKPISDWEEIDVLYREKCLLMMTELLSEYLTILFGDDAT